MDGVKEDRKSGNQVVFISQPSENKQKKGKKEYYPVFSSQCVLVAV